MKRIAVLLLCILGILGYSQRLTIAYEITSKPDKTNKDFVETSLCLLNVEEGKSYFFSPFMNNPTKQIEIIAKNKDLSDRVLKSMLTTYIIQKDIRKNKVIHYFKLDETFAYEDKIDLKCKITNATKEILGYECGEAKTTFRGRNYTAYYAKDLPVSNGP